MSKVNDRIRSILQVNTADVSGGAEKVALRLHRHYLASGIEATLAVGWQTTDEPGVIEIPHSDSRSAWARAIGSTRAPGPSGVARRVVAEPLRYMKRLRGYEDFDFPGTAGIPKLPYAPPRVIHLHNLHGAYFDIRALPSITAGTPVVYSPHDPWVLTGHCAHPIECPNWLSECGSCPDLRRYVPIAHDKSHQNWLIKHRALASSRLWLVSPSQWMLRMFLDADVDEALEATRVIPNGVDTSIFKLGDPAASRASLDIDPHATVLVTSARSASANDFKGADVLHTALGRAAPRLPSGASILVLTLGDTAEPRDIGPFRLQSVPFTSSATTVANFLRAADIYIHPSRAENYPLTVLEALACGTPVIASDAGGTPEITGSNAGALSFAAGDSEELSGLILQLLSARTNLDSLKARARDEASTCYTAEQQSRAYLDLYAELIESRSQETTTLR